MLLTVILSLLSVIIIILSYILVKTGKASDKTQSAIILCGFAVQLIAVIASFFAGNGFTAMSIAVMAADLFIGLPKILYGKITNKKIICFIENNKKWLTGIAAGTAAVLLFEAFICNFGAFNLIMPSSPNEMILPLSRATVNGSANSSDVITVNSGETVSIEFTNINYDVRTIYADVELSGDAGEGTIEIAYSDETTAEYRYDAHLNYIGGNENSKYIICSFSGKVGNMKFNVKAPDGSTVVLKDFSVNKAIPFHFSWIRFIIILAGVLFLITLAYCSLMKRECGKSKSLLISSVVITAVFVLIGTGLLFVREDMFSDLFSNPDTNQINKELVDAFEAGQVSLLETPPQELLELENPYDYLTRQSKGISYLWDHVLFEGKYYSYYGIGSVLTLFLPYHMITGKYFSSLLASFIYSIIGIVFLTLTYFVFIKRFFPKISNGIATAGLVIVQASSFIWYLMIRGDIYELAQTSGFAFLMSGAFFLLSSGVIGKGKVSRVKICISTVLLSIAVLCRAVLALYCVVALLFIYAGVKKIVKTSENPTFKANKKPIITFLLAALLPFVLIGSVQMVYNYLRFGSVFEFGIKYSLTINDFTHIQFHIPIMLIAFYNYLFTVPKVSTVFPFITTNYDSLSVNGYCFLSSFSACGLIFRAVPVLGYVFGGKAYKKSSNPNKRLAAIIIISGCIIVPFIQMFLVWSNGYTPRYAVDFAWQMIFGAFAILFVLHEHISEPMKRVMYFIFAVSAVISVVVNFALIYEYIFDYGSMPIYISADVRRSMASFARLFEFWNIM